LTKHGLKRRKRAEWNEGGGALALGGWGEALRHTSQERKDFGWE